MSSSGKNFLGKTTLNPNAVAFVPSAFRSTPENSEKESNSRLDASETYRKPYLDRSGSNISNGSDDEAHRYWRHQLPDDITPDFNDDLSLAGLSIDDGANSFPLEDDLVILRDRMAYSSRSSEEHSSKSFMNLAANAWDDQFIDSDQHLTNGIDPSMGFFNDLSNDQASLDHVLFLASQFPGFAADSLAEVYYANGCDLNLTVEMLTQLELQVDSSNLFGQNTTPKALSAPRFDAMDFPALSAVEPQDGPSNYGGREVQSIGHEPFPSLKASISAGVSRGGAASSFVSGSASSSSAAPDFASAVRRLASQDSGHWKLESSNSQSVPSLRSRQARAAFAEKIQQTSPAWLETGDAVAQLYSQWREEARDFARLRNTCFEQSRQAFLVGNKALAKELSLKGKLYDMQMKEAHEKARDAIYRHRNPGGSERGKQPLIDLHGLHVNEAVLVLRHELGVLRKTAQAAGQLLQVMVCVGTGHHTKGSRTPARLPAAVHRHLTEEGLPFSEDQPGLLRVLIR